MSFSQEKRGIVENGVFYGGTCRGVISGTKLPKVYISAIEKWGELWSMNINEDKIRAIYFSHRVRPPEVHLT
jgi:hypothetical protein